MRWWILLWCLAGTCRWADARDARPVLPVNLDLESAAALAVQHNPAYLKILERLDEQEARLTEVRGSGRPQLNVRSDYTVTDENRLQSFGAEDPPEDTRWGAEAEASLTVFSGGRQGQRVQRVLETSASVEAQASAARQDIIARVHEAYYDAQLAGENVRVQQEAIEVLEEQRDFSRNRLEAGVSDRFELMQAEVALANARPPLIRAENDVRRNIDVLRRTLGVSYPVGVEPIDIVLEPVPLVEDIELDLQEALELASAQRPELEALARQVASRQADLKAIKRERAPLVDIFATYGIESDQFGDGEELEGWTAGVRLTWDLLDGGNIRGRSEQVESQMRQLKYDVDLQALDISGEVRTAFYDYEEARSILEATEQVVEQAEEALRLARNRFEAGRGTQLEVLESQLQLTRARQERATALNGLQRALVAMKRAVGLRL